VDDPREMADHYQKFCDWAQMPGFGVCGFVLKKPV